METNRIDSVVVDGIITRRSGKDSKKKVEKEDKAVACRSSGCQPGRHGSELSQVEEGLYTSHNAGLHR